MEDNWDDWFKYSTQYYLYYTAPAQASQYIGQVKIGQLEMREGQRRPEIPEQFEELDASFFSLGQDPEYYERLGALNAGLGETVLGALRDVALNREIFIQVAREDVTATSLMRSVPRATIEGQFHRIATGGARLSRYKFLYRGPTVAAMPDERLTIDFDVVPESQPPTNIHVLIGRNGVGKTHLLNGISRSLMEERSDLGDDSGIVMLENDEERAAAKHSLAGLVYVSFSAFDTFEPISRVRNASTGMRYSYVGLKTARKSQSQTTLPPKTPTGLARDFGSSVNHCIRGERLGRWRRALEVLEADPIFADADIALLAQASSEASSDMELRERAMGLFRQLSSGHKIVLLTITRLVETVDERTLVLLDEPEAHLHPPLLSAFIRELSDLLVNRNGVAVIATHSPVVLQEVPSSCVWKLRRSGRDVRAERPQLETFGENVGVLTREVFGLEVTRSGFHRILEVALAADPNYERILARFEGRLGAEAKAILSALLAADGDDD
ncbi:AAA family ATPase [Fodinicola acaciae]|uniref:AAA family ATPase n=1 Tax=Fodinicola acaciae TaxID=2681555 RepID=UPI001C9E4F5F|nr:AAA family ATPase [Fodinicola acaciae]